MMKKLSKVIKHYNALDLYYCMCGDDKSFEFTDRVFGKKKLSLKGLLIALLLTDGKKKFVGVFCSSLLYSPKEEISSI